MVSPECLHQGTVPLFIIIGIQLRPKMPVKPDQQVQTIAIA